MYHITIEVSNRSGEEIGLHEVTYSASAASVAVYDGRWASPATLAPHDSTRFDLPVVFLLADEDIAAPTPDAIEVSGSIEYTTPDEFARALQDAGLRRPRARFSGVASGEDAEVAGAHAD